MHTVVNWQWLANNVTLTGADKAQHMTRSLRYYQILSPLTLHNLFVTLVENPIRPSLMPITAALAYWLLGVSMDAGPMINILYLAILLSATYGLGTKLSGRVVGLLATVLVGTYPMIYAMSRLFYLELALTAMVTATLYFLVASEGFQRRGASLAFGLCLGLGLLTKRTFVVFALVPILYMVLRTKVLAQMWRRLTSRPRVHWQALLAAVGGGAALAALWFWPNSETIATLVLGNWLFPLWWFLAALTIYVILLPSAPEINMLAGLSLGATVASVWYLARIEFIVRALGFAYSDVDATGHSFVWFAPGTYSYYLSRIVLQHISSFYFAFTLLAGVVLLILWLRKRQRPKPAWWVLVLWIAGGYTLLTFSLYRQSRAILPVLPPIALLTAAGLIRVPWKQVRAALITLMVVGGVVQWVVLSFTPFHTIAETLRWGQFRLFAQGSYVGWPDYGPTDPGWAIHEDLLQRMEQVRQDQGRETLSLGLLANAPQLNAPQFQPLILINHPSLVVDSLNRAALRGEPAYPRLFEYDFVAIKRHNRTVSQEDQAIAEHLLDDPPQAFTRAFELDKIYHLPDGDALYVYKQRYSLPAGLDPAYLTELSSYLAAIVRPGDAILLNTPAMLASLARHVADGVRFYQVGAELDLTNIVGQHERIFIADWTAVQTNFSWLDQNAYPAGSDWFGDIHLATYGTATNLSESTLSARFGSSITLDRFALPEAALEPGDILPLALTLHAEEMIQEPYKIFAHLLAADGTLVAQYDGEPVGGLRPTNSWLVGEEIEDRCGILLPQDLPAGAYTLAVGWYPTAGGERLPVSSAGGEPLGDQLVLGTLAVVDLEP